MSDGASVKRALARIDALVANADHAPLELERALKDLAKIETRLEGHEYLRTTFDENTFCMQERSRMLLVEIDFYARVGRLWSTVLDAIDVHRAGEVLDIGPGWFPKVEMGLVYSGYEGRLRIVDKSAEAIANLRTFLGVFDPKYSIEPIVRDFLVDEVAPAEVVAGNHFVDDVIVDRYCRDSDEDPGEVYREEAAYVRVWSDILARGDEIAAPIVDVMARAFERLLSPGGTLVVAQYPSYMERRLQMPQIDRYCRDVLDEVGRALAPRGFEPVEPAAALPSGDDELFGRDAFFVFRRER